MRIDWLTVFAQIVNFLILVWLLKRFLYRPVLKAMAKREQRLAARFEEAREKTKLAEAEKGRYFALQEELRHVSEQELLKAKERAEAFRAQLLATAKEEVTLSRDQWLAALEKEKRSFLEQTSTTITHFFEQLLRNALRDLADMALEERIAEVFLRELARLSAEDLRAIGRTLAEKGESVVVSSAFPLSTAARQKITHRLAVLWGREVPVVFQLDTALIAGITMAAAGKKIKWDVGHYLEDFQKSLASALERETLIDS